MYILNRLVKKLQVLSPETWSALVFFFVFLPGVCASFIRNCAFVFLCKAAAVLYVLSTQQKCSCKLFLCACAGVWCCVLVKAVDLSCIRRPHPPLIPTGLLTQDPPAPGRNSKDPRAIHQNMGTSVGLAGVQMRCCLCVHEFLYLHGYQLAINGADFLPGAELPDSSRRFFFLPLFPPILPRSRLSVQRYVNIYYISFILKSTLYLKGCFYMGGVQERNTMRSVCRYLETVCCMLWLSSFPWTTLCQNPLNQALVPV